MQVKALQQEKQKLFLEFEALATEKEFVEKEVMALKEKEKEKEEDIVVVGWNQAGHPVDFEVGLSRILETFCPFFFSFVIFLLYLRKFRNALPQDETFHCT